MKNLNIKLTISTTGIALVVIETNQVACTGKKGSKRGQGTGVNATLADSSCLPLSR